MVKIKRGFEIIKKNGLAYLAIPAFEDTGMVKHCFTSRIGGVSQGIYNSLNTSDDKEDPIENVHRNLELVCEAIGVNYRNLVFSDQTHEDNIRAVTKADLGKGITIPNDITHTDGLMTNIPGIPLITFYADCVPLFFLDKENRAIAVVHSGWKGTVLKIGAKTIRKMMKVYGTNPENCLIGIGPSIEMDCFEVGPEVAEQFIESFGNRPQIIKPLENGKYVVDLWAANKLMLMELGVPEDNITISGFCTKCSEEYFFSYRRDKGRTGSMSAIMELK
ncbi:MAG: peptidoglycan editing factor PgeF [Gracilibacteraceae bacterium]|nr:peptidoglycan editing factor PgeF [Gracilibacteraceae bacterium]